MLRAEDYAELGLSEVYAKVVEGRRLSLDDGERLFACPDILAVGALAHHVRVSLHGKTTYYVMNRHVNYTNVCVNGCLFCAFGRKEGEAGGFALSAEDILGRIAESRKDHITEVHIVGGCHPGLRLGYYLDLLSRIKAAHPELVIKAFTAVEIAHMAAVENMSTLAVLAALKEVGLSMLPGGGAEIFAPEARERICPNKASAAQWLRIAGEAHGLGIPTNATMLFGHVESIADRLTHLDALRRQQDQSGGFLCFIPLPFLTANSPLRVPPERVGPHTGLDILRTMAVSRLMLDNIPHLKSYWVMLTAKLAQAALCFGANDFDGMVVEEKIGHMAGAESEQALSRKELTDMIEGSGFVAVERDSFFQPRRGRSGAETASERTGRFPASGSALARDEGFAALKKKVLAGGRLSFEEAMALYSGADLLRLGRLAHEVRMRKHPERVVTYVIDRNINYSNICACACKFCAYYKAPGQDGGFVLTKDELEQKIRETMELGGSQILMQGGMHPDLPLSFYEDMLRGIKNDFPVHIHAFSPPEIMHFSALSGLSVSEVIARLKAAGLDSIPGGGAEILVDRVRQKVSPRKCSAGDWLAVMQEAHAQGLRTTATMMFGHEETPIERLEHLFALRTLQDETHGFTAFIPWTFQSENTALPRPPETSVAYLRLLALARLVLDNFDNLQVSWVTMGPRIAQLALFFGANDFGSTMIEENVVAAAGVRFRLSEKDIHRIVAAAGFTPRRRSMDYTLLPEAPAETRAEVGI